MSAAARGAAGAIAVQRHRRLRGEVAVQPPADAIDQAAVALSRFIKDPARARELAAEAVQVTVKRRRLPAGFATAPKGA